MISQLFNDLNIMPNNIIYRTFEYYKQSASYGDILYLSPIAGLFIVVRGVSSYEDWWYCKVMTKDEFWDMLNRGDIKLA